MAQARLERVSAVRRSGAQVCQAGQIKRAGSLAEKLATMNRGYKIAETATHFETDPHTTSSNRPSRESSCTMSKTTPLRLRYRMFKANRRQGYAEIPSNTTSRSPAVPAERGP